MCVCSSFCKVSYVMPNEHQQIESQIKTRIQDIFNVINVCRTNSFGVGTRALLRGRKSFWNKANRPKVNKSCPSINMTINQIMI